MEGLAEDISTSININEDCRSLSPIVEMDEPSFVEDKSISFPREEQVKLNLETVCENLEDRTHQPAPSTPPEVLRVRLKSLQSEFEELKEFTDLERQTYHLDCVPKDQVQSLEEYFALINDKLQRLMQENKDYQRKLENIKIDQSNVQSQLLKAWKLQSKSMALIEEVKQSLKDSMKHNSSAQEVVTIPPCTFMEKCEEDAVIPQVESYEQQMLNSLKSLEDLVKLALDDKRQMQDEMEHLQTEFFELNERFQNVNENESTYGKSLISIKSNCNNLKNRLANIESELAEISMKLFESESKQVEVEITRDAVTQEMYLLKSVMDDTRETLQSVINIINYSVPLLDDNFVVETNCTTHEDVTSFKRIMSSYCDVHGISRAVAILVKVLNNLENELKLQDGNHCELKLNVEQLNNILKTFEIEASERKLEVKLLEEEVHQRIPSKLAELENSLTDKDKENYILKNNLKAAHAKVDELLNKLAETELKNNQLEGLLLKNSFEKSDLENETTDYIIIDIRQNRTLLALKSLELIITSWDEKSNIGDLIDALQRNEDILCVASLFDDQNQTVFSEVAMKYKSKLLLHDEVIHNCPSNFKCLANNIESLLTDDKSLRAEVNTLDEISKERIGNKNEKSLETTQDKYIEEKDVVLFNPESQNVVLQNPDCQNGNVKPLKGYNEGCNKLEKEMNNLNKASKAEDIADKFLHNLNEIENLIESWDSSGSVQIGEFICQIREGLEKYSDVFQSPILKANTLNIVNKFEAKLIEFFETNNKFHESEKSFRMSVEDCKTEQGTVENFQCVECSSKEKRFFANELCKNNIDHENADQLKAIKHLMVLEITCLDENESEESLMCDSLENVFKKLMQIIMEKEDEMSISIQDQLKEEFHNKDLMIEKLTNKLKSQESWINELESENEKMNIELSASKTSNNLLENKVKALSADLRNKDLETSDINRKILELKARNYSIISELNANNELVNDYIPLISSLKDENEMLQRDNINKTNIIKQYESQTNTFFNKQPGILNYETTSNGSNLNDKRDFNNSRIKQINSGEISSLDSVSPDPTRNEKEVGICLSELLNKEITFMKDLFIREGKYSPPHEVLTTEKCYGKLVVLREITETIGGYVLDSFLRYKDLLQSVEIALNKKTKEMNHLKLIISKLYKECVPNKYQNNKKITYDCFENNIFLGNRKEVDLNFCDATELVPLSTKGVQSIFQNLREAFKTIVEENNKMTILLSDHRKSVEKKQKSIALINTECEKITLEKHMLELKDVFQESEITKLKTELSEIKAKIFSQINLSFPNHEIVRKSDSEKVLFVNETLKQYSETQNVCFDVTENLRFFCYQFELMLLYIQNIEYKLYFVLQQKDLLSKENISLKEQISMQQVEMNKFINLIISNSPFAVQTYHQALEVINQIFSDQKLLKENVVKLTNEHKLKQEKIMHQQTEMTLLTKENASLRFELTKCEDSVRNLRSELRNLRLKCQRQESVSFELTGRVDSSVQTEGSCCRRLQKKIMEQKENINILTAKLSKSEQVQRLTVTSNPYNKQVTYLDRALNEAKEKLRRLNCERKCQDSLNQELVEAVKRHESCQQRFDDMNKEIEKLKNSLSPK